MGNKCYFGLQNLLRSNVKHIKPHMEPVVLSDSESQTLTKVNEDKMKISERKILRKIYGPNYVNGE
jgi:hypothetical protein